MNQLPVETRIDILSNAVGRLADVVEMLMEHLPAARREGPDFADIVENLERVRHDIYLCMEV